MGAKKILMLAALAAVVFAAACIGGPPTGVGVIINLFSFNPATILDGQPTYLELQIQNLGDVDLTDNVYVYLYGMPDDWTGTLAAQGTETSEVKDFKTNKYAKLKTTLRAPDEKTGAEGQKETIAWQLTSPGDLPRDLTFGYDARIRVCAPYTTTVIGKVEFLSSAEWLLRQQRGILAQKSITYVQTAGPVQVSIASQQPLVATDSVSLKITISNTGGGTVSGDPCDKLDDPSRSQILSSVKLSIGGTGEACKTSEPYYLEHGQSKTITATCDITGVIDTTLPQQEIDLQLSLEYNYYVDSSTRVVVTGVTDIDPSETVEPLHTLTQPMPLLAGTQSLPANIQPAPTTTGTQTSPTQPSGGTGTVAAPSTAAAAVTKCAYNYQQSVGGTCLTSCPSSTDGCTTGVTWSAASLASAPAACNECIMACTTACDPKVPCCIQSGTTFSCSCA